MLTQRGAGVQIDTAVPLAEAARAHDRGETNRAGGKIVLAVAP
ncbi:MULTISPECIES: zinc-binding dehydrogenase [Kitasatospora]